jgi:hypothetical protein
MTLSVLAKELDRRAKSKQDFVAPVSKLTMAVGPNNLSAVLTMNQGENLVSKFGVNRVAHEQISDFAGIPMTYYRRMLENDPTTIATIMISTNAPMPANIHLRCFCASAYSLFGCVGACGVCGIGGENSGALL